MGFKERLYNSLSIETNQQKLEKRYLGYYEELLKWRDYTLEFLNSPIDMEIKTISFFNKSEEKKIEVASLIFSETEMVNGFYAKLRIDTHKKYNFERTNCASYASYVSTFSQYLNPNNETIIYSGTATVTKSPNKKEIGKLSDHFWVTVNGKVFDNSESDQHSYTDLKPILMAKNTLSGRFNFEEVK